MIRMYGLEATSRNFMFRIIAFIFICLNLIGNPLCSFPAKQIPNEKDFFVLTVPKSGTHLILKLLLALSSKSRTGMYEIINKLTVDLNIPPQTLEQSFLKWKQSQFFFLDHLDYTELLQTFQASHPEYIAIIHIRDLRDVFASWVDWTWEAIEEKFPKTSFEQKLMHVLKNEFSIAPSNDMNSDILSVYKWLTKRSNIIMTRFEDLVGPKGGGSRQRQKETILKLTNALSIPLTQEKLEKILDDLWGIENTPSILAVTFKQGKIGRWKESFNEEHKKVFKEKYGDLLIQLGYEKDNNW